MKKFLTGLNIALVRLRFILVFVAVGLVVGNWTWIMNVVEKVLPKPGRPEISGDTEYYCGMCPGIVREQAGNCPV